MTTKQTVIAFVLLFLISGAQFYQDIRHQNRLDALEECMETHTDDLKKAFTLPDGFTYVYERFALYNAKIDTGTVVTFLSVVDSFGLREDTSHFDLLIGQILLESGARQVDSDGKIIFGGAGEVGISQIGPTTGLYFLSKVSDPNTLLRLGASDFSFASNKSIKKKDRIKLTIDWLSDVDNNLILWGYIMRDKMEKNGILKGLVAYNAGTGGMRKFISKFQKPERHTYIKSIRDTLHYVSTRI